MALGLGFSDKEVRENQKRGSGRQRTHRSQRANRFQLLGRACLAVSAWLRIGAALVPESLMPNSQEPPFWVEELGRKKRRAPLGGQWGSKVLTNRWSAVGLEPDRSPLANEPTSLVPSHVGEF